MVNPHQRESCTLRDFPIDLGLEAQMRMCQGGGGRDSPFMDFSSSFYEYRNEPKPDALSSGVASDEASVQKKAEALDEQIRRLRTGNIVPGGAKAQTDRAIEGIQFIARHLQTQEADDKIMEDWKFVAMVIDRLFLVLFCLACLLGTSTIILQAPTLYDERQPIDVGNQHVIHTLNGIRYCDMKVVQ